MRYKTTLFIIILLSSFSIFLHFSMSSLSFIPLFFPLIKSLLGTYSAPGTEDALMFKTWPSWNLDGGVGARTETGRVRALWMLFCKGTHNWGSGSTSMKGMVKLAMHSRPLRSLVSCFPPTSLLRERESLGFWPPQCLPRLPYVWQSKRAEQETEHKN